jgi:hypothetical protein
MHPKTNRVKPQVLKENVEKTEHGIEIKCARLLLGLAGKLSRPNGVPVLFTWGLFQEGKTIVVEDYTFKIAHIGGTYLVLEPIGSALIEGTKKMPPKTNELAPVISKEDNNNSEEKLTRSIQKQRTATNRLEEAAVHYNFSLDDARKANPCSNDEELLELFKKRAHEIFIHVFEQKVN